MEPVLRGGVMEETPRILVATDNPHDAELVCGLLEDAYPVVARSTEPKRFAEDFDAHRPHVLVIAFKSLEAAESYYLGLYRTSTLVNEVPHRTLMLCAKEDVPRAYAQCCKGHFDDYVLFWPLVHDAKRLPMSVRLALRALAATHSESALASLAEQARRIGDLEAQLDRQIVRGHAHADHARAVVQHAHTLLAEEPAKSDAAASGADIVTRPVDGREASGGAATSDPGLRTSLERAVRAIQPIQHWIGGLKSELAGPLDAIQALTEQTRTLRRLVLVVDDDAFMRDLVARVLGSAGYDVESSATVDEMLVAVGNRRPDLIIMDVMLPGIDGILGTRRLKATPGCAQIPVIMLTGQQNKQIIVDSMRAGAVDYVVKPFDRDTLLKKVERRVAS